MRFSKLKRAAAAAAALTISISALAGCSDSSSGSSGSSSQAVVNTSGIDTSVAAEDLDVGYDEANAASIVFKDTAATVSGNGVSAEGAVVTIEASGEYVLSGSSANGQLVVNADKDAEIKLVLKGLDLSCENNAPIYVKKAKKVIITLEDGTENVLTDGESYELEGDENTDGCLFSKADLTINGSGSLTVNANYKHGIVSKDDLVITDGSINVTSASTALEGKDCVKISGGELNLDAGKDGIRSTNDEEDDKGFISVSGGNIEIISNGDAFQAETLITVTDGAINAVTGGSSENASMKSDGTPNTDWQNDMDNGGGGFGGRGFDQNGNMEEPPEMPDGGMGTPPEMGNAAADGSEEVFTNAVSVSDNAYVLTSSEDSSSTSAKGFKAEKGISISGGTITIDSADDSLHTDGSISVSGGEISISSGDDAVHADENISITDGTISIGKSHEGIEGLTVTIDGGNVSVNANDDGINCGGGSDSNSDGRMGKDEFAAQEGVALTINGGVVNVVSSGDGLDSNGDLYINGGEVYVSGSVNGGNGALDYNGEAVITGGTVVACGAVGMEEGFTDSSTQYSVLHDLSTSVSSGQELTITDSEGNTIASYTPQINWQSVVFSSPDMKDGATYTITCGDVSETVTTDGIVTSNATGGMGGMRGGMGGDRGDFGGRGGRAF